MNYWLRARGKYSQQCMVASAVLVTRPEPQAGNLCAALAQIGVTALAEPMMQILPEQQLSAAQRQQVFDLDQYQHIIFISTNAVRFGMALIEDHWPQLPVGVHWYAIGERTRQALSAFDVSAQSCSGAMTSESLLQHAQLQQLAGQRVLIVKGFAGRTALRSALQQRQARVDELACYRRIPANKGPGELWQLLQASDIGCILITSGEGLENMLALLSRQETTNVTAMTLVVPSRRVAELAMGLGFRRVIQAANATDEAMVAAVQQWLRSREIDSE